MSAVSSHYPVSKERKIDIPHIREVCKNVIAFFKKNNPFRDFSLSYKIEEHEINNKSKEPGCTITIRGKKDGINENESIGNVTFVFREDDIEYPIKYSNQYKRIRTVVCEIPSVSTDETVAGQKFGFFLIRLAMIISILGGAIVLTLDNVTDHPERAVQPDGIYGLLQPNMRSEMEDKRDPSLYSKEYLNVKAERVRYLEPTDIHIIRQNLTRAINGLLSKEEKKHRFGRNFIWKSYADDILRNFFKDKTIFPNEFQGGKRRKGKNTTKKQKKRRPTHKRRRSSTTRR